MVGFAGDAFARAFFVVEPLAVLLLETFDVLVLRHGGGGEGLCETRPS